MKYDQEVYELIMDTFNQIPLAAIIDGHFLAVHAGISPELEFVLEVNKLTRNVEPPVNGVLCDILWSDPVDNEDGLLP